jgi:phosphoglycerate dehydrogenase-like enzyme
MNEPRFYVGPGGAGYLQEGLTSAFQKAVTASGGALTDRADEADVIVYNGPAAGLAETLHPGVRWLQLPSGGVDPYVASGILRGIPLVTCGKSGCFDASVGEQGLALLLAGARRLPTYARATSWVPMREWFYDDTRGLAGRTVVIIGCGGIGSGLVGLLAPFDARVIAVTRRGLPVPGAQETVPAEKLDTVLPQADFVVIAAPLTQRTRGLIDTERLSALKPTAWLVNLSRGGIVNTDALVQALRANQIGGAALEMVDPSPLPDGHPLWSEPRALVVPHTATLEHLKNPQLAERVRENVRRFLAGRSDLLGIVDLEEGY